MNFETRADVLEWYEKQPRTLTTGFVENINWKDVRNYPIDKKFVPVLRYMRDIETLTDVYYDELRRTQTGKDPIIGKFMERWSNEEKTHGELINRFLNEAGIDTGENWRQKVLSDVPGFYTGYNYLISTLTNLAGKKFTAVHMAFGAIHEMSTMQAYRRLMGLAGHPVLSEILNGIVREESSHSTFYRCVAKLELEKSHFSQKLARFIVKNFWTPVGSGARPKSESDYTIAMLFAGEEGVEWIDRNVTQRLKTLPGLSGLTNINETIRQCSLRGQLSGRLATDGNIQSLL